jgi:hypothetical protein
MQKSRTDISVFVTIEKCCRFKSIFYVFFRVNKTTINHEDFDKKRSRAAIKAQALKEMEKEKEVSIRVTALTTLL